MLALAPQAPGDGPPNSTTRPGFELLELLVGYGVCKERVAGDSGAWETTGWSSRELEVRSEELGHKVGWSTWTRHVARPKPGQWPYLGDGTNLTPMVNTLQSLGSKIKHVETFVAYMRAWAAIKGVPLPPNAVNTFELNALEFGESPADVLARLIEAADSRERVRTLKDLAECLTVGERSQVLAYLAELQVDAQDATEGDGPDSDGDHAPSERSRRPAYRRRRGSPEGGE